MTSMIPKGSTMEALLAAEKKYMIDVLKADPKADFRLDLKHQTESPRPDRGSRAFVGAALHIFWHDCPKQSFSAGFAKALSIGGISALMVRRTLESSHGSGTSEHLSSAISNPATRPTNQAACAISSSIATWASPAPRKAR
jgi:hypothetical protein